MLLSIYQILVVSLRLTDIASDAQRSINSSMRAINMATKAADRSARVTERAAGLKEKLDGIGAKYQAFINTTDDIANSGLLNLYSYSIVRSSLLLIYEVPLHNVHIKSA